MCNRRLWGDNLHQAADLLGKPQIDDVTALSGHQRHRRQRSPLGADEQHSRMLTNAICGTHDGMNVVSIWLVTPPVSPPPPCIKLLMPVCASACAGNIKCTRAWLDIMDQQRHRNTAAVVTSFFEHSFKN